MAVIRKCVCCGREYEFCPNCSKANEPAWKVSFCSETCKELFNVVSAYNAKRIDRAAVNDFIAAHGITDTTKYSEPIRKVLERNYIPESTPVFESTDEEQKDEEYVFTRRKRRRR